MIDWQKIDTVLLDMDGTLLDLHFDNYFWLTHLPLRYAEIKGVSEAEATALLMHHIRQHEGTLQWYCLDHWSALLELDIPLLKRELLHKIQLRPYVEDFLRALRVQRKKVMLITNAHPKGLELKLSVTAIDQWLDLVVSSHEYFHPKESEAFWQKLQAEENFDPKTTLFIDDTPRVLASAENFGIAHLVHICAPDSQREPARSHRYLDINHFDEIMPH